MMRLAVDSRIDDEARDWVYRIAAGEPREACAEWRALDPAHDAAFVDAWRSWRALAETRTARSQDWRHELQQIKAGRWYQRPVTRFALPTALAASIAAAVIVLPGMLPLGQSEPGVAIATATAQDKVVTLKDGSKVTVGADSELAVNLEAPGRREVVLKEGQAFFEVAHNAARPFYVLAGDAEIRVVGTKFDVRRSGNDVQVSVLEGRVEVRRRTKAKDETSGATRILTAGEQSTLRPEIAASFAPEKPATVTPGEWRSGRRFYVDGRLGDIVEDANRYSTSSIRLDPKVAEMRMTTSFRSGDTAGLVANIEATLKLQGHRTADGSIELAQR